MAKHGKTTGVQKSLRPLNFFHEEVTAVGAAERSPGSNRTPIGTLYLASTTEVGRANFTVGRANFNVLDLA
jgi:hypothetical protein